MLARAQLRCSENFNLFLLEILSRYLMNVHTEFLNKKQLFLIAQFVGTLSLSPEVRFCACVRL